MVDYSLGKIYCIYNKDNKNIYIGSTSQLNYRKRFNRHDERMKLGEQTGSKGDIYNTMNYKYILLEEYPCKEKKSLLKREQYYMDTATDMKELILTNYNRCYGRNYHYEDDIPKKKLVSLFE